MTTGDEAIDAAFSSASPTVSAQTSTGDEAIDAAFANQLSSNTPLKTQSNPLSETAHGIGTLFDVVRNVGRTFSNEPTIPYGSPESYASRFSTPLETSESDQVDPKEAARLSLPKLGDQPVVKKVWNAMSQPSADPKEAARLAAQNTPFGQTMRQDVLDPAIDIANAAGNVTAVASPLRALGSEMKAGSTTAQEALDAAARNSPQSTGAAASAPQISSASPALQQAVGKAVQKGPVNMEALTNHWEADQHGVQLTEGQATRDPATFSDEQNSTHRAIVKRINDQNQQLTDAIDNVRREAAPGAVHNDPIENGQIAVDSLKAYDEPIKADIDAKYNAARAASAKGDLQMDGSSFVSDANAALKPQSKFRFLPSTVRGILDDVEKAGGRMSLDDYQAYDTQLGNEIAKAKAAGDGNAVTAVSKVRDALQRVEPVGTETAQAKTLFDTARAAAKARFDALDADPAYRAAVDDVSLNGVKRGEPSALADKFLDKYALQAPKANVDRLMGKLDSDGQQAVTAHTLSTIRKGAVTPNGFVSPNGFNGAVAKYGPKLESLVPPETRESLDSLGRVITNVKVPPPGHFVNYSKSGVIANAARGVAQPLGEAALNAKTFGLGVPIIKGVAENRFAKRVLAPGAGISRAQEITPPP